VLKEKRKKSYNGNNNNKQQQTREKTFPTEQTTHANNYVENQCLVFFSFFMFPITSFQSKLNKEYFLIRKIQIEWIYYIINL
jgi:hypothetical protein